MRYGDVLPSTFIIPKSAFWLRNDLERNPFATVSIERGDVVMDCGSYIGTFAAAALEQGANVAYCYEASPKTFDLLTGNMAVYGERAVCKNVALVPDDRESTTFYLSGFT